MDVKVSVQVVSVTYEEVVVAPLAAVEGSLSLGRSDAFRPSLASCGTYPKSTRFLVVGLLDIPKFSKLPEFCSVRSVSTRRIATMISSVA